MEHQPGDIVETYGGRTMVIKPLEEFTAGPLQEMWFIVLDGRIVDGYDKLAFSSKQGASNSFNHRLSWSYRQYGYSSSAEMKHALINAGRLEFVKLDEIPIFADSQ